MAEVAKKVCHFLYDTLSKKLVISLYHIELLVEADVHSVR